MPVKLNIGLSRKVGEPNYGSRGASINLEVELDSGVLQDAAQLRERVRDLYQLARQSIDEELHRPADVEVSPHSDERPVNRISGHANNGHKHNSHGTNGEARNGHANGQNNGHSNGVANGKSNGHANGQNNGHSHRTVEVARASSGQIRAIFAISKRLGLDPNSIIQERFRVYRMEDLTMREASSLIDDLQSNVEVRN